MELLEAWLQRLVHRRHRHETYAIGLTRSDVQAFAYRGAPHASTPGLVVVLRPDGPHDGHAGTKAGFGYRQLYVIPTVIAAAARMLGGHATALPFVRQPVMRNPALAVAFHTAFAHHPEPLAIDAVILDVTGALLMADPSSRRPIPLRWHDTAAVARACQFLDAETTRVVHSWELEAVTGLTRYELIRQFRASVGSSPYRYSLMRRLARARAQIAQHRPLDEVAAETGFADQAHFTRRFIAAFGITPGQYGALTSQKRR